jgi:hypothetical protein
VIANYLTNITCTTCGLTLMRSPRSAVNAIVFCAECRSGGHYHDVVEDHKALTPDFITLNELEAMLSEIGSDAD